MGTRRVLPKPPITEALVDIRIVADSGIDAARLQTLRPSLVADYPQMDNRQEFKAELKFEAGNVVPSQSDLSFNGLFFWNADRTRLAQFRRDGFTLNHLRPYHGADALIAEAIRLWDMYAAVAKPAAVVRVGMRYINRMHLPLGQHEDFNKYMVAAPVTPAGMPQAVSSFLTRLVSHAEPYVVMVTQTLDQHDETGKNPVSIDIDAFHPEPNDVDSEALRTTLGRLRDLKNDVFFALFTDEALDLFQ